MVMPPPEDWLSVAFGFSGVDVAVELAEALGVPEPLGDDDVVVVVVVPGVFTPCLITPMLAKKNATKLVITAVMIIVAGKANRLKLFSSSFVAYLDSSESLMVSTLVFSSCSSLV
jgi:hypothetical protein